MLIYQTAQARIYFRRVFNRTEHKTNHPAACLLGRLQQMLDGTLINDASRGAARPNDPEHRPTVFPSTRNHTGRRGRAFASSTIGDSDGCSATSLLDAMPTQLLVHAIYYDYEDLETMSLLSVSTKAFPMAVWMCTHL